MSRRRKSHEEVEMNVTAMLDMAFQLLSFFIMTFTSPRTEGQIMLHLPPPEAILGKQGKESAGDNANKSPDEVKPVETLTITLLDQGGAVSDVKIGIPNMGKEESIPFNSLEEKLRTYFEESAGAFKQVVIQGTPHLHWSYVMQAMEICSRQKKADGSKLDKLSFICMPDLK